MQSNVKCRVQRVLLVVTAFLLGIAVVLTIQANWKARTLYLLTDQFWDDFVLRFQGAGRFRFLLQPGLAVLFGIIGGRVDAARGHHGYLSGILSRREGWRESIQHGIETIGILVNMGVLADIIFQYILLGTIHVIPALILGPLFITVPYITSRGISSRIHTRSQDDVSHE